MGPATVDEESPDRYTRPRWGEASPPEPKATTAASSPEYNGPPYPEEGDEYNGISDNLREGAEDAIEKHAIHASFMTVCIKVELIYFI